MRTLFLRKTITNVIAIINTQVKIVNEGHPALTENSAYSFAGETDYKCRCNNNREDELLNSNLSKLNS